MYSFKNDYSEGAHPAILEALSAIQPLQLEGYGEDSYSRDAADHIKAAISNPSSSVHFIPVGTQTNLIFIASCLRSYEAVIAAETGHICVHETGAIEATGHKILPVPSADGKLTPALIQPIVKQHEDEHMVLPRLVYISQATEVGSHYTKHELEALSAYCKKNQLFLYMDGARLGSALQANSSDVQLPDLARLTDAFYIGGTKNGGFFGEALVINNVALQANMRFAIKQRGGLLAKGWLLGLQFKVLFTDHLYFDLAQHANVQAAKLKALCVDYGFDLLLDSDTNQQFPIIPNTLLPALRTAFAFYDWSMIDAQHTCIRLVTSWATSEASIQAFATFLKSHLR